MCDKLHIYVQFITNCTVLNRLMNNIGTILVDKKWAYKEKWSFFFVCLKEGHVR